jgi:hypothetical protein
MKKIILSFSLSISILLLTGCGAQDKALLAKHEESSKNGLNRTVDVYSANGTLVKHYEGKFKIEIGDADGTWTFIYNGKEVKIADGIRISEEK